MRRSLNRIIVVPLTSNVGKLYPSEAYVRLGADQRKAMADQLTTASKLRLQQRIGHLDRSDMAAIDRTLRTQLDL